MTLERRRQASQTCCQPIHISASCFVMRCHVRHAFADTLPFQSRISFLHRVPFRRRAAPGRRDPVSRVSRVRLRPRVGAGAVRAPDCARETADARLPSVPAGAFFGPSRFLQKRKRRPRKPPLSTLILLRFSPSQAPAGNYFKILVDKPLIQEGGARASLPSGIEKRRPGADPIPMDRLLVDG